MEATLLTVTLFLSAVVPIDAPIAAHDMLRALLLEFMTWDLTL
jgi:hypothetical protein